MIQNFDCLQQYSLVHEIFNNTNVLKFTFDTKKIKQKFIFQEAACKIYP